MEKDQEYIEKLNLLMKQTPKISILNASPKAFVQLLEFMDSEQLDAILELYEFDITHNDSRRDPFFIANYTYIRHYMTTRTVFEPIKVADHTILFCKN